ncbi:MAG TPA: HD-GYP domain-containing protein [Bacteriovoracaceae bacterium]|nr:HD-GYP domain-containing protein [Bacteriovoracaceae bacterium]
MKKNNVFELPSMTTALSLLGMAAQMESLKADNKKISEQAARTILKALDAKDHYTFGHSMRVAYFSLVTGAEAGLTSEEMYELELSAIFHDIGKIGTPDAVLNKPSRLTEDEFNIMKQHPEHSWEILQDFNHFEKIATIARSHHERYDGKGYPQNLKGDEIPVAARIILIADTFDAMTSTRPYRKGLSYEVAFAELIQFSGSQFDPKMVELFIEGMRKEALKNEEEFFIPLMARKFHKNAA